MGRKYYSTFNAAASRTVDALAHRNSSEVFGGLFSAGVGSNINYDQDYVRNIFQTPKFDKVNLPLQNDFHNQFMRQMLNSSNFNSSGSKIHVGQGFFTFPELED